MTAPEELIRLVLARLEATAPAPLIPARPNGNKNVRRTHRVPVSRDDSPEVQLVDGNDRPRSETSQSRECRPREVEFVVSIIVRADDGYLAADPIVEEVITRLDMKTTPYSYGSNGSSGRITLGDVLKEPAEGDVDSLRVDMHFRMSYETVGFGLAG